MEEVYIDSNIFIYGFLDEGEQGKQARSLLKKVSSGKLRGHTSTLTFDEVSWKLLKQLDEKQATQAIDAFLTFPSLNFINVDKELIRESAQIMQKHNLLPRDAIHAAACIIQHLKVIISEDKDFDRIKSIRRKGLKDT